RNPDRDAREGRVEAARGSPWKRPRHPLFPTRAGGGAMTFLERTTDARKFRHWEGDVEADYIYTSGVAGERFFVALRDEGRMLASRCAACKLDYLPPRMFCEDCFAELTEYVDVPRAGQVAAVTVAHVDRTGAKLSQPQVWAFVTFEGIRGGLFHRLLVAPKQARAGLSVRVRLKPRDERTGALGSMQGRPVQVDMMILDIMGKRTFLQLFKEAYFHGAKGVLAVFDVTRAQSLRDLTKWIDGVRDSVGPCPVYALGNKTD